MDIDPQFTIGNISGDTLKTITNTKCHAINEQSIFRNTCWQKPQYYTRLGFSPFFFVVEIYFSKQQQLQQQKDEETF